MFPLLASADPVRVTANIQGTMSADAVWMGTFTGNLSSNGGYFPFTFTLSGEIDPDSPDVSTVPYGDGQRLSQFSPNVVATMTIDGIVYPIEGITLLAINSTSDRYFFELYSSDGSRNYIWHAGLLDSNHGLSGDPLAPRELTAGGSVLATFSSDAFPLNPDAPGMWSAYATTNNATITISAVPEPSHAGMLLAGLFVLALARPQRMKEH